MTALTHETVQCILGLREAGAPYRAAAAALDDAGYAPPSGRTWSNVSVRKIYEDARRGKCRCGPCWERRRSDKRAEQRVRDREFAQAPVRRSKRRAYQAEYRNIHREVIKARLEAKDQFTRSRAVNDGFAWTREEDLVAASSEMTALEIALALGRSLKGVRNRRSWLRKRGLL